LSSLQIRSTTDPADLRRVHALRREAFVVEQALDYDRLDGDIDNYSTLLVGELDGELVASVRVTCRRDGPLEDEAPLLLPIWSREFADAEIFQASRLVVAEAHRRSTAAQRMIDAVYRLVNTGGGRVCFADCRPELVDLYLRIGMRQLGPAYVHPKLGHEYIPLVTLVGDRPYFERTRVLLGRLAEQDDAARARAVYERHVDPTYLLPDHRLAGTPGKPFAYYLVNDVLRREAANFETRCYEAGAVIELCGRFAIIARGQIALERGVVLELGDYFGTEVFGSGRESIQARACQDAELLLLTRRQLVEQLERFPSLALTVVRDQFSRHQHASASFSSGTGTHGSPRSLASGSKPPAFGKSAGGVFVPSSD
jgi:predicted GNAT family N-acyltransferase/CRP-like cAMP-binding protein